ncbi:MAG: hypothetical protein IKZ19_06150 [Clostridia bacterium]|nr:hypothetical protein [Clostridia bacterium]
MADDFVKAIKMEYPERIPVGVSFLPAMWLRKREDAERLVREYPMFFPENTLETHVKKEDFVHGRYNAGTHVDEWGCVWSNMNDGMDAIVTDHPVKEIEDVFTLKIPEGRTGNLPHGFMYLRLLDLCGFENAMIMFAEEGEEIETLISKVLEYNRRQVEVCLPHCGEVFSFGDDLGMQTGLAIGPERWRKYMKPCFVELYGMVKKHNPETLIYMHTDGCIYEIMPDLVECGVDMINPQFRANGLDNLVRVCRREHTIPINLDLDRQLFPFATRSQIFDHVAECVESLYLPQGGLGINIELNYDVPTENCAAIFDAVLKYRDYKGH